MQLLEKMILEKMISLGIDTNINYSKISEERKAELLEYQKTTFNRIKSKKYNKGIEKEIGKRYVAANIESYKENENYKLCKNIYDNFKTFISQGKNIIMQGNRGTGKTYFSAILGKKALKNNINFIYMTAGEYDAEINNLNEIFYNKIKKIDLLIIDQLGAKTLKDYAKERLSSLLEYRERHLKSVVLISNFDNFKNLLGLDIADRIGGADWIYIYYKGASLRKIKKT